MIKEDGVKTTPKKIAQSMLMDAVANCRGYWAENEYYNAAEMTKRERIEVNKQMTKIANRIAKMCSYENSWRN